ncbi:MAG: hypothetical protein U1E28_05580 [Beijerinckiaceae bacterium]
MSAAFDTSLIQGNILRSYRMGFVRHLLLEVADRRAAKRFLAVSVAGGDAETPAITHDLDWGAVKPDLCFNIGITYEGLKVLGTPAASLATFPTEFIEGMNARALKLGDFGDSSPEKWPAPFDKPKSLHLIASIYAQDEAHVERVQPQVEKSFNLLGVRKGQALGDHKVYFGYRDDISQPRFRGVKDDQTNNADEPVDELGTALLGHPTRLEGLMFRVPSPPELGLYGSFNAFRVLEQDVFTFERYLDKAAKELLGHPKVDVLLPPGTEARIGKNMTRFEALREVVAAQMCGRWRNGAPLATSPDFPSTDPALSLTNFEYDRASRCPAGSHIRRTNPRGGRIVQRVANYTRRLVRRGMSYGPTLDLSKPDEEERGLLGNFIGASIGAQFEAVMCDWLNLGLHDPTVTGSNDPLIGANTRETSWFDLALSDGDTIRLREFPRFVRTRGGAYTFLPSMTAIEYLSKLPD